VRRLSARVGREARRVTAMFLAWAIEVHFHLAGGNSLKEIRTRGGTGEKVPSTGR